MDSKKDTDQYSEEDGDHSFDFILDKTRIDTSVVKRIGIQVLRQAINIVVQTADNTIIQDVEINDFFNSTITPLKKQLNEIPHKISG